MIPNLCLRRVLPPLLLLPLLFAGCYTMLHHPTAIAPAGETTVEGEAGEMGAVCSDCHYESEWLGYYDHPLIWDYPAYSDNAWWGDYYGRPWWYEEHWFDGSYSSGGSTGGRSWWERRAGDRRRADDEPDYGLYPGAQAPRTGGSATGSPSGSSSSESKQKQAPDSSKKKKKTRG